MARKIFYRENHFTPSADTSIKTPKQATEILLFLTSLPHTALPELRHLKLSILNAEDHHFDSPGISSSTIWIRYRSTIDFIRHNLNLQNLVITIALDDDRRFDPSLNLPPQEIKDLEEDMWRTYESFVEPFIKPAPLPLRNFFVYLTIPVSYYGNTLNIPERDACQDELEKRVMGAKYDAIASGKFDERMIWRRTERLDPPEGEW